MQRLTQREAAPANLLISGARLFDGDSGLEGVQLDVRVVDGTIAEIGSDLEAGGVETIDAAGLTMTPGLIDPHVHLRTPGDEDEEDIASGTNAAAAGGFVAILAMPNTDPVVDSAAVLSGLIERAGEQAAVPTGFFAAISRGLEGRELVDMAELAARGAAGFSDDGRPVERAGMLRRALQYSRVTGLKLTLHEEDTTLTAGAQMHEGAVSAELGLHGYPGIGESVMVGRDLQIARYEHAPLHLCHISAAESVAEIRRAKELGVEVTAEVSPHHLCLTDELVRDLDPAVSKMNPPLRSAADRAALIEALADGTLVMGADVLSQVDGSDWESVGEHGRFGPIERRDFPNPTPFDADRLVAWAKSTSKLATMPPDQRAETLEAVREFAARHPGLGEEDHFTMPFVTVTARARLAAIRPG